MAGNSRSGRRPLPTAIIELHGNRGKRKLNYREPKPAKAIPLPPSHLDKIARAEWSRVSRELYDLGILSRLDRGVLAAYCDAYSLWVRATVGLRKPIKDGGGLTRVAKSGVTYQNPLLGIANAARRDMNRFSIELGMTPAARSRVKVDELPKFGGPEAANDGGERDEFFDDDAGTA